jgi:hypothetical protein
MLVSNLPYPVAFVSTDGRRWDLRLLPGGAAESLIAAPFAACRDTVYAVNADAGGLVVWRTRDGKAWDDRRLPGSGLVGDHTLVTIAAGPRGVLVARANQDFTLPAGLPDKEALFGFESWYSPDGENFRRNGLLPLPHTVSLEPGLVATQDGFLLHDTDAGSEGIYRSDTPLYQSPDGRHWTHIGDGLPKGSRHAVGRTGDLTFVLGQTADGRVAAHYKRDGETRWRSGSIDPGALPDAGVRPADQLRISFVHPWKDGYLAVGTTTTAQLTALVWTSPDGIAWTRMPVRDNGFDNDVRLSAIASSRGKTVLFGMSGISSSNTTVRLWEADER